MQVLKFGGSSLADAAAIRRVAEIVLEHSAKEKTVVVCSACVGVTNALARIGERVRTGRAVLALTEAWAIRERHREILFALGLAESGNTSAATQVWAELEQLGASLRELIARTPRQEATGAWMDEVLSFGERMSVRLVAGALRNSGVPARAIDATEFIVTDGVFQGATPLWKETRGLAGIVLRPLLENGVVPVVTGFIGATENGEITTLGRNSSDFSAAIVGDALDADEVWLWTDVDGIFDRDPNVEAGADEVFTLLSELSYDEALDLARNGAKVLHPRTIEPLRQKNIALRIRNTFRRSHPGTRVGPGSRSVVR
jgi:aspartokinase/homoserine dehydrogenase 1